MGLRIYELAKEFGVDSKKVIEVLKDNGEDVKSHLSSVDADIGRKIIQNTIIDAVEDVVEEKIVESVKQEFRDIEEKIDEITTLPISNFVPNVVEEATEKVEEVREAIEEKVDSVIENVEETVDEVVERVEDIVPNADLLEQKLAETRKKIIESQSPRGIIGWILSLFGIKG